MEFNEPTDDNAEAFDLDVPIGSAPAPVLLATDSNKLIALLFGSIARCAPAL